MSDGGAVTRRSSQDVNGFEEVMLSWRLLLRTGWVSSLLVLGGCERLRQMPLMDAGESSRVVELESRAELNPSESLQRAILRDDGVVDGDTLRAVGFDQSIRLLCLDTDELPSEEEEAAARADWEAYQALQEEESAGAGNYGTLMGIEAREFAREYFRGVEEIFVEYQSPQKTRGFFGRHLGYVWTKGEDGQWRNYNVEAVRAGMSIYATDYGRCDAYDTHFRAAQQEARQAGRGIWAPGARGYQNYEERLRYGQERAGQIDLFRRHFEGADHVVELGTDTARARMRLAIGERLTLFGSLERYSPRGRPPKLVFSHRFREEIPVVAAEGVEFEEFGVPFEPRRFYYVNGIVELYRGNPQLRVDRESYIRPGLRPPR